jgi:hypothetical protein
MVKPIALASLLLLGARGAADVAAPAASAPASSGRDDESLVAAARAVVRALDARDFAALGRLVDEREGLSFAPYLCERGQARIARADVAGLLDDKRKRRWGAYDGSGLPIVLSFRSYFKLFVYDHRYAAHSPELRRARDLRCPPESPRRVVRFYLRSPPTNELHWGALYLVFTPTADGWRLVEIIHDEWTI